MPLSYHGLTAYRQDLSSEEVCLGCDVDLSWSDKHVEPYLHVLDPLVWDIHLDDEVHHSSNR